MDVAVGRYKFVCIPRHAVHTTVAPAAFGSDRYVRRFDLLSYPHSQGLVRADEDADDVPNPDQTFAQDVSHKPPNRFTHCFQADGESDSTGSSTADEVVTFPFVLICRQLSPRA